MKIINFKSFFCPWRAKSIHRAAETHFFTWVTHLPIEMNVHIANIFWQIPQIPALCPLASKIIISNWSPWQGRRVNRLPCRKSCVLDGTLCCDVFPSLYLCEPSFLLVLVARWNRRRMPWMGTAISWRCLNGIVCGHHSASGSRRAWHLSFVHLQTRWWWIPWDTFLSQY